MPRLTDEAHHPSNGAGAVRLDRLEIAGNQASVDAYLGSSALQPLSGIDVDWVEPSEDGTGVLAAVFETAAGTVRLD